MSGGGLAYGEGLLLRYLYNDGRVQAALPLRTVADTEDMTVAWLAPRTQILYWATEDGADPRATLLPNRFRQHLTTAPRIWKGPGVLRVMPMGRLYQVIHFWTEAGDFAGWYINFEAPRRRIRDRIDTVDWHLDLSIAPDGSASWKDEEEAQAALGTMHLRPDDYRAARGAGEELLIELSDWPLPIGDWRRFQPDPAWTALDLARWSLDEDTAPPK